MDGLVPLAHRLSEREGESDLADTMPFRKTHVSVSNGYRLMRTALGLGAFLLVGLAAAGNATVQADPPQQCQSGLFAASLQPCKIQRPVSQAPRSSCLTQRRRFLRRQELAPS